MGMTTGRRMEVEAQKARLPGRIQVLETGKRRQLRELVDVDSEGRTQEPDDFFRYTRQDEQGGGEGGAAGAGADPARNGGKKGTLFCDCFNETLPWH